MTTATENRVKIVMVNELVAMQARVDGLEATNATLKAELEGIIEPVMEAALDQITTRSYMESEGDPEVIGGIQSYEVTEITGPDYITYVFEWDSNIPTSFKGTKDGEDFECTLFEIKNGELHYEVIQGR